MYLDVGSLLTLMLVSVVATAGAVATVMGFAAGTSARWVVAAGLTHAAAWGSFLLAAPVHDRVFSTIWIALLGASFACMWRAVCGWTGGRPCKHVLAAAVVLTPLGYGLGFESYPFRVGWSNAGLCLAMITVCVACLQRAPHAGRRWRGLLVAGLGPLAAITLARGILGAFFTASYPELRTPHPVNLVGALLGHVALVLTTLALCVAWREEAENALRTRADTDPLTGLLNRRAWLERAEDMLASARRYGESLALLLLDVDHFKQLNDTLGHEAGDQALTVIGRTLAREIRAGDLACRWGGEEFCVLVRHAGAAEGCLADARLRRSMAREFAATPEHAVTFSSGMAVFGADLATIAELLRSADAALYRAKALGRGRLMAAEGARGCKPSAQPPASGSDVAGAVGKSSDGGTGRVGDVDSNDAGPPRADSSGRRAAPTRRSDQFEDAAQRGRDLAQMGIGVGLLHPFVVDAARGGLELGAGGFGQQSGNRLQHDAVRDQASLQVLDLVHEYRSG